MLLLFRRSFARSGIVGGGPMAFSLFGAAAADARRDIVTCDSIFSRRPGRSDTSRPPTPTVDVVPAVEAMLILFPDAAMYAPEAR